jgi:hypothetical protein
MPSQGERISIIAVVAAELLNPAKVSSNAAKRQREAEITDAMRVAVDLVGSALSSFQLGVQRRHLPLCGAPEATSTFRQSRRTLREWRYRSVFWASR